MNTPFDKMIVDQELAVWACATTLLEGHGGDSEEAIKQTTQAVGHGITQVQADLIIHHIEVLAAEKVPTAFDNPNDEHTWTAGTAHLR